MNVPGYQVLEVVGRGGHAVVYRARQLAFDRIVALKVLTGIDVDGSAQRRFERECRAAGALSWHLHIVAVHDAGTTGDGQPYLAMEFFERGSFADRVARNGPLTAEETATIGVQLCGALETAHRAGTLHRDVKPENVLVSSYGEAKLGDFGIATLRAEGTVTSAGVVTATVAHAAPEVLSGAKATEASDLYSLGSTMFALLAGKPAFIEPTDETLATAVARIMTAAVPDLTEWGVPADLARLVAWSMEKDPMRRPKSAADFGSALQEYQRNARFPVTDMRLRPSAEASPRDAADTVTVSGPPSPPGSAPASTPPSTPAPPAASKPAPTGRRWVPILIFVSVGVLAAAGGVVALASGGESTSTTGPTTPKTQATEPKPIEGLILITGSNTVRPITQRNIEKFTLAEPGVEIEMLPTATGPGFEQFCRGLSDINNASRPIAEGEIAACQAGDVDFIELLIARDSESRPQFIYVDAAAADHVEVSAFVDFYLSDDGLASVTEAGLFALTDAEVEETRRVWNQLEIGTRDD
ncbi:MAG: protein kinase [Actinobacteria bacterium]|nr:protein kinase [Actinomycetota bacterium]